MLEEFVFQQQSLHIGSERRPPLSGCTANQNLPSSNPKTHTRQKGKDCRRSSTESHLLHVENSAGKVWSLFFIQKKNKVREKDWGSTWMKVVRNGKRETNAAIKLKLLHQQQQSVWPQITVKMEDCNPLLSRKCEKHRTLLKKELHWLKRHLNCVKMF